MYNDIWLMNDSNLLLTARDTTLNKGIRAIAYARLGDIKLAKETLTLSNNPDFVELEAQLFIDLTYSSFNIEEMSIVARRVLELEPYGG